MDERMNQNILGKTYVITGATSGIGLELARLLAQRGYDLLLASRDGARMADIQKNFSDQYGIKVLTHEIDLSEPHSAVQLFERCQKDALEVEVLVNNSGFVSLEAWPLNPMLFYLMSLVPGLILYQPLKLKRRCLS